MSFMLLTGNSHKYSSNIRNLSEMTAQKKPEKQKKKLSYLHTYESNFLTRQIEKSVA